jgi:hypothetical protein
VHCTQKVSTPDYKHLQHFYMTSVEVIKASVRKLPSPASFVLPQVMRNEVASSANIKKTRDVVGPVKRVKQLKRAPSALPKRECGSMGGAVDAYRR